MASNYGRNSIWLILAIATLASLNSCIGLPTQSKLHTIRLYSRGLRAKEIATVRLRYRYKEAHSADNYFYAELYSIARPIELLQIPPNTVEGARYYLHSQKVIPEAFFEGVRILKYRMRQPFRHKDQRWVERLLLISKPDSLNNILSLDFYLFPSKRGYILRLDLRSAAAFNRRISAETKAQHVANILSHSEQEAIFHNQTIIGQAEYF